MSVKNGAGWLVVSCLAVAVAGCGGEKFDSHWTATPVKVDGKLDEWQGAMTSIDNGEVSVGFENDGDDLYLAVSVNDRRLGMRAVRNGLTIWLDPSGGKAHTFGVKYPVGNERGTQAAAGAEEQGERGGDDQPAPGGEGGGRRGRPTDEQIAAMVDRASYELEVIEDGNTRLLGVDDAASRYGIDAAMRMEDGAFHAEMKVPLKRGKNAETGLGVSPGRILGVSLDSPVPQRRMRGEGERMGGGMRGGGMGGMGGGGWGRGGMGGGFHGGGSHEGGRRAAPEPIKVWVKVQTATKS